MTRPESGNWTASDMHALGTRHATLEAEGTVEAVMATVSPNPVYTFWPVGRRAEGRDLIERYYAHLMGEFIPRQRGFQLLEEWCTPQSLAQEYAVQLVDDTGDGTLEYRIIGVLFAEDGLIAGERIWASEACLRAMLGPVFDACAHVG